MIQLILEYLLKCSIPTLRVGLLVYQLMPIIRVFNCKIAVNPKHLEDRE
jgi:hypothetical protein